MGEHPEDLVLRMGTPNDAAIIAEMVGQLAEYERLAETNRTTEASIRAELQDPKGVLEVLVAEVGGEAAAMATFFTTYSTFAAKRGIYLEDIFVKPEFRHRGIGTAIMRHLAHIARQRDCGRMEWSTLLWNSPAIEFYDSLDATPNDAWTTYRLTGDSLKKLAARAKTASMEAPS